VKSLLDLKIKSKLDVKNALVGIVKAIHKYKATQAQDSCDAEPLELDTKVFSATMAAI